MADKQQLLQNGQYDYPEQNPQYQGDELDPQMKSGPLEDRGCKDFFWCILYVLMLAGLVVVSVFAFQNGDPNKLLAPFDSAGNQCGYGTLKDFPNVYVNQNPNTFFCVSSCPGTTNEILKCGEGNCPQSQYESTLLLTVCFPNNNVVTQVRNEINSIINLGNSQETIADLKNSWPVQLITAFVALIISLLVTVLIRYMASCLVWTVIALYFVMLVLLGYFLYETATNPEWQSFSMSTNHELLKGCAYLSWALAGLSLLIFVCLIKKITLAIAVMKAAADFTRQVCEAALVPLVMFIVISLFLIYWLAISVFLVSCGKFAPQPTPLTSPFGTVILPDNYGWLLFYDLFALYWNCNFAMAFSQFVIASSCCMWYFSHMGHDLSHPVSKSVVRGLFHHSGSLALGSLILAIVGIIRFCLDQVHKAFKETTMNRGVAEGCAKCWFSYCTCCLAYFEKFIRFLNQNAYIMIALSGNNFCKSAHDAFYLIFRNALKITVTHGLGEIFTVLGNMFIGISSTVIGYLILTQISYFADNIVSPVVPTLGFLIISFVIGSLFMNVYGMAVDSILLCYIADSELNSKSGGAKSIPPSLKEFLDEYK